MYERDEENEFDEETVQNGLVALIRSEADPEDLLWGDAQVETFEEAGVMTYNKGLVVRLPDGSEFQVTIVQSR